MTDVQSSYRQVAAGFDAAVRSAGPDNWQAQSPCEGWTARDVVAHIVEGHRGVIAAVRGGDPTALGVDEDAQRAWDEARRAIEDITAEADARNMEIDGPTGKAPAGQIIGQFMTMDLLVHTWDLARAVGADDQLAEDRVREAFDLLQPMDAMIRRPGIFGPRLEPPPGADLQTEFLCFTGRHV